MLRQVPMKPAMCARFSDGAQERHTVFEAHPCTRPLMITVPIADMMSFLVLLHAIRARPQWMQGAKAGCGEAKPTLQIAEA